MKNVFFAFLALFLCQFAYCESRVDTLKNIVYDRACGYWSENFIPEKDLCAQLKQKKKTAEIKLLDLKLDIYRPDPECKSPRPLVVLMHGGAFYMNHKGSPPIPQICSYLAARGYVAVSFDYRMGFSFKKAEIEKARQRATEDFASVLDFLTSHGCEYGIDTSRIVIGGASSGAITALRLAFGKEFPIPHLSGVINMWGSIDDLSLLDNSTVPILSFHGDKDSAVPFRHGYPVGGALLNDRCFGSYDIHQRRLEQGYESSLTVFEGYGHAPYRNKDYTINQNLETIREKIYEFLLNLSR